jgi:hypothetical protein
MRRTYISPEYTDVPTYGTYNTIQESNFFSSKMISLEDTIYISNQNIIYYQRYEGDQLDLSIESSIPGIIYSSSESMYNHHFLYIEPSQSGNQKITNTKWYININFNDILWEYLYATMKKYRTFENIRNDMTMTNDVNYFIKTYIYKNVLNKYKYSKVDLYLLYENLKADDSLRYLNTWNPEIISENNKIKNISTKLTSDNKNMKLSFTQEHPSSEYNFNYYFCITFERI